MKQNSEIKLGANVVNGKVTYQGVAEAFGLKFTPIDKVLKSGFKGSEVRLQKITTSVLAARCQTFEP